MRGSSCEILHSTLQTSYTSFFIASKRNNLDVLKVLVRYGADPNIPSNGGNTPLLVASHMEHVDIVKYLIGKKCAVNVYTQESGTLVGLLLSICYTGLSGSLYLPQ